MSVDGSAAEIRVSGERRLEPANGAQSNRDLYYFETRAAKSCTRTLEAQSLALVGRP